MECRRCKGLMVPEWCSELFIEAYVMRCLNCGAILDPTIERNQGVLGQQRRPVLVAS